MKKSRLGIRERLTRFLSHDIWQLAPSAMPLPRRLALRTARFVLAVWRGFVHDDCSLHATALTYYTLMAIVPVLALALSLGRVFGGDELVRAQMQRSLTQWLGGMQQAAVAETGAVATGADARVINAFVAQFQSVAQQLFDQIHSVSFGTLGGLGAVALLWMVVGVLGRVESSFNRVWGVTCGRSLWRKFSDYLFVVLIVPFLITAASTVPVMDMITHSMGGVAGDTVKTVVGSIFLKKVLVLGFGTLTFSFLLVFMPNTRVHVWPALAGGALTAVLFSGWLRLCAMLQVGIVKYSALYGGFAMLPILLVWVYTSWQIILLGAEFAFALQNGDTCRMETSAGRASPYTRVLLAVAFCAEAARSVRERGEAFAAEAYALERRVSARLAADVLGDLVREGVLLRVEGGERAYLPCRDLSQMSVADVARIVLHDGVPPQALGLNGLDPDVLAIGVSLESGLDRALAQPVSELGKACDD